MNLAALLAVDPAGLGGAVLRGSPGPARDRWVARLRAALPSLAPVRRVPLHVSRERLLGGLDLAATLRTGRRVAGRGLLEDAAGGVLLLAMAERISPGNAACVAASLDRDECFGVLAFDEGRDEECVPAILAERLAFHVTLDDPDASDPGPVDVTAARALFGRVTIDGELLAGLCATAAALGIASLRAPLLASRVARAAAALAGRARVDAGDAELATRLVLAPRATVLPQPPSEQSPEPEAHPAETDAGPQAENAAGPVETGPLEDMLIAAAAASIPPGLLARLADPERRVRSATAGRMGTLRTSLRGRPAGVRAGDPRQGLRLNVIETLRAAAPWQRLRGRAEGAPVQVRREDFRVTRLRQRSETTTIFVVDASGSQALNRLAEAKGAVELLLAECYARRDRVAVLAFRGRGAELLLPPTRSLVRARRSLAGLPGGGGTPLASGIDAGRDLADATRRRGGTPAIVLLTDGRGNVGLDGRGGRAAALRDTDAAARRLREAGHACVLVDTSTRPNDASRRLAAGMGARYVALPFAGPASLARAARRAMA